MINFGTIIDSTDSFTLLVDFFSKHVIQVTNLSLTRNLLSVLICPLQSDVVLLIQSLLFSSQNDPIYTPFNIFIVPRILINLEDYLY